MVGVLTVALRWNLEAYRGQAIKYVSPGAVGAIVWPREGGHALVPPRNHP